MDGEVALQSFAYSESRLVYHVYIGLVAPQDNISFERIHESYEVVDHACEQLLGICFFLFGGSEGIII